MAGTPHPISLLRRPDVENRTGMSRSEIYRRIAAGTFPAPIALGPGLRAWPSNAIDEWIDEQIARGLAAVAGARG